MPINEPKKQATAENPVHVIIRAVDSSSGYENPGSRLLSTVLMHRPFVSVLTESPTKSYEWVRRRCRFSQAPMVARLLLMSVACILEEGRLARVDSRTDGNLLPDDA
eukprot:1184634-Prorocentrum_minimum.AAC.3